MNKQKDLQTSDSGEIVFLESKTQYDMLQSKVKQLEKEVKELEQNNQQLKQNLTKRDRDYSQLITDLEKYKKCEEENIINREQSSIKLLKQFKLLEIKINEQDKIIMKLKEQNQILLDTNKELENQKEYFQSEYSVIDQEKQKIFNSLHSRKQELQEIAQEKQKYEEELQNYKQKIKNLEDEIERLLQKQIDQELQITHWQQLSGKKEQICQNTQEELTQFLQQQDIIKQPNQDEFKKNIIMNIQKIEQEIGARFSKIEEEQINNESLKEIKRNEQIVFLNQAFNIQLRLKLQNKNITFKHEFRDNQIRE